MTRTRTLLDLAVTVHPEPDAARCTELALLAGRLGYTEVWLAASEPPEPGVLGALAAAAAPARLGLRLPTLSPADADRASAEVPNLLLMADTVTDPVVTAAAPGRLRGLGGAPDPAGAGVVVTAGSRADLLRQVAAAVAVRDRAGLLPVGHPVLADVPVAIGRTMQEAEARAVRDPRFAGDGHPRERGLFGTYEHGQGQVLELAAAGADGLLVTPADELDVADLLAQVRSLVVGATPVLHARRG